MKYLLVVLVVVVGLWLLLGRSRTAAGTARRPDPSAAPKADVMVSCAHCGLHLPTGEAVADAEGRLYCSDAHRLGGPR